VSLTTLSVKLHIYATNSMTKCVHADTKIENRSFYLVAWHGPCV